MDLPSSFSFAINERLRACRVGKLGEHAPRADDAVVVDYCLAVPPASRPRLSTLRTLLALPLLATLVACGALHVAPCPSGQQAVVQELLYFGADKPAGRVNAEDWAQFLEEAVTPRFPDGLTAWPASGQWRSASSAIVHEPAYVLSLVHPASASTETAIQELVASYKARFQQEAVLRVRSEACMSL
jgi:hypothetical protein